MVKHLNLVFFIVVIFVYIVATVVVVIAGFQGTIDLKLALSYIVATVGTVLFVVDRVFITPRKIQVMKVTQTVEITQEIL